MNRSLGVLLLLLILVASGSAQVTVTTNMRQTGGDGLSRGVVQIDSLIYITYDSGTTAGRQGCISNSTAYGSDGTWTKQSLIFPTYTNERIEGIALADTGYFANGANDNTYYPIIRKIYGTAATLGQSDTVLSIAAHSPYNMAFNYWNDTAIFFMDSSSAILYARYTTNGRLQSSVTWANTAGAAINIAVSVGKRSAFSHGLLYMDISATSGGDAYNITALGTKVVGSDLWTPEGNSAPNLSMTPQSPNSDTIYFAFERGDTVWLASYYLRTSDTTLVQLQLTYLTNGAGVPSTNTNVTRRQPQVVSAGDSVAVLYRHMSDTLNTDSVDIRYRISGDRGLNWSTERILLAATNANGVFCLSAPYFYDWTACQHIVFAVYTDAINDAQTHTLRIISDTVGTNAAPPSTTPKRRSKIVRGDS